MHSPQAGNPIIPLNIEQTINLCFGHVDETQAPRQAHNSKLEVSEFNCRLNLADEMLPND